MNTKYTMEKKLAAVQFYLSGGAGLRETAKTFEVGFSSLRAWVQAYQHHGSDGLAKVGRRNFSGNFKLQVIQHMEKERLSSRQVAAIYDIPRLDAAGNWQRKYKEFGMAGLTRKKHNKPPPGPIDVAPSDSKNTSTKNRSDVSEKSEIDLLRAENAYLKKLYALVRKKR